MYKEVLLGCATEDQHSAKFLMRGGSSKSLQRSIQMASEDWVLGIRAK